MSKVEELFKREGEEGVLLFKESLRQHKRNATNRTSDSITSFVEVSPDSVVLEIRAVGHPSIQRLEEGFTAEQAAQDPPDFQSIVEWTRAKGFGDSAVAGAIFTSIINNGWNIELPNRTPGLNGGTAGILSDPRAIIMQRLRNTTAAAVKEDLLQALKERQK